MKKPRERLGRLVLSPAILSGLIRVAQTGGAGEPQAAMRGTGMRPWGPTGMRPAGLVAHVPGTGTCSTRPRRPPAHGRPPPYPPTMPARLEAVPPSKVADERACAAAGAAAATHHADCDALLKADGACGPARATSAGQMGGGAGGQRLGGLE